MQRVLALLFLLIATPLHAAEELVAAMSKDNIGITTQFTGSEVLIYGAVRRDAPEPYGAPLHVIVTLEGPPGAVTVRRKDRRFGIWINTESLGIAAAPTYYAVATTGTLSTILRPEIDQRERISVPLAIRSFDGPVEVEDTRPFTEALLRIRENEGLYALNERGVRLIEQTLFRAEFLLPANLVEGNYKARIFLTRDGRLIDKYQAAISVQKVGLERWVSALSKNSPLGYGLLSLIVAVAAGWAASEVFARLRR